VRRKRKKINRRNFLKTLGTAGLTTVLAWNEAKAGSNELNAQRKKPKEKFPQVPKRKLGKTGIEIPCLSHGIMYNLVENQIILTKGLQWGISSWDTSPSYAGGNSELGIGKFLSNNPELREKLFIVTKAAGAKSVADVERCIQGSLKKMNTKYVDLYYGVKGLSDPARLTDELKLWAENAKKRKLIRFFGFCTHKNMAECLAAAAKLDWIDAIMTSYNFRFMQDAKMQAAIEACHKAGIGLIAMKTQGQGQKVRTKGDKKLTGHFLKRGFTQGQAKIKVVLQDERFSSACVGMKSIGLLTSNVAAVLDKTKLSQADMDVFTEYAQNTCSGYCAGCAQSCDSALPEVPYVSDIMRYLMYYKSYSRQHRARKLFAQIPGNVKDKLLSTNYSDAEARCPQHLPIAKLIAEAVSKLA
jgi:predicted aldo/keto reductase-like oxidoreductase